MFRSILWFQRGVFNKILCFFLYEQSLLVYILIANTCIFKHNAKHSLSKPKHCLFDRIRRQRKWFRLIHYFTIHAAITDINDTFHRPLESEEMVRIEKGQEFDLFKYMRKKCDFYITTNTKNCLPLNCCR